MNHQEQDSFRIELDLDAHPAPSKTSSREELPLSLGTRLRALPETSQILWSASRFASNRADAIAFYNADPETMGGRYISGDEVVRVMPRTKENPLLSYRFAGETVAALPLRMFRNRMAMPPESAGERVLLTMGMPACGKTTLVKGGMGSFFHTIVDSPLASLDTARELRQVARESGREVAFVYAHRPLALAIMGMLERALPWNEGRTVSLEQMGNILVKGLALFRDLAASNPSDDGTTLDLVEVIDGRRYWFFGPEAARRIDEIRADLHQGGASALGQLVHHWMEALCEAQRLGWEIPKLLVELVQEDLDPRILATSHTPCAQVDGLTTTMSPIDYQVRSLSDIPGIRTQLHRWAEQADTHEALLRTWRGSHGAPKFEK